MGVTVNHVPHVGWTEGGVTVNHAPVWDGQKEELI